MGQTPVGNGPISRWKGQEVGKRCHARKNGSTSMVKGGLGFPADERGTTTTVLLASLIGVAPINTQGRFFLISAPVVGSRLTQ